MTSIRISINAIIIIFLFSSATHNFTGDAYYNILLIHLTVSDDQRN